MLATYLNLEEFKENFRDNYSGYGGTLIDFLKEYRELYNQTSLEFFEKISLNSSLRNDKEGLYGMYVHKITKQKYSILISKLIFPFNQHLIQSLIDFTDNAQILDHWKSFYECIIDDYCERMDEISTYIDEYIEQERVESLKGVPQVINSIEDESDEVDFKLEVFLKMAGFNKFLAYSILMEWIERFNGSYDQLASFSYLYRKFVYDKMINPKILTPAAYIEFLKTKEVNIEAIKLKTEQECFNPKSKKTQDRNAEFEKIKTTLLGR